MSELPPRRPAILLQKIERRTPVDSVESQSQEKLHEFTDIFDRARPFLGDRTSARFLEEIRNIQIQIDSDSRENDYQKSVNVLSHIQRLEANLANELQKVCDEADQDIRSIDVRDKDKKHLLETAETYLERGQYHQAILRMCLFLETLRELRAGVNPETETILESFRKAGWLITSPDMVNSWLTTREAPETYNNYYISVAQVKLSKPDKTIYLFKSSKEPSEPPTDVSPESITELRYFQSLSENIGGNILRGLYDVEKQDGVWKTVHVEATKGALHERKKQMLLEAHLADQYEQKFLEITQVLNLLKKKIPQTDFENIKTKLNSLQTRWKIAREPTNKQATLALMDKFKNELVNQNKSTKAAALIPPRAVVPEITQETSSATIPPAGLWQRLKRVVATKPRQIALAASLGLAGGAAVARVIPKEKSLAGAVENMAETQPSLIKDADTNTVAETLPKTEPKKEDTKENTRKDIRKEAKNETPTPLLEKTLLRGESFKTFIDTIKANHDLLAAIGLSIPEKQRVGLNQNQVFSRWLQAEMIRLHLDPRNGESQDGTVVHPGDQFFLEQDHSGIHIRFAKKAEKSVEQNTPQVDSPKEKVSPLAAEKSPLQLEGLSFGDTVVYQTDNGKLGTYQLLPATDSAKPGVILKNKRGQFFVGEERAKKNIFSQDKIALETDPITKKVTLGIEELGDSRYRATFGESGRGVIWALARLILKESYQGNQDDWALALVQAREAVQTFKQEVPNLVQPGGYLEAEIKNEDWKITKIQAKK